jgi:hypothetical protein
MLTTNPVKRLETVSAASVRGHIWRPSDSVNAFLQFYFNQAQNPWNPTVLWFSDPFRIGFAPAVFNPLLTIEVPVGPRFTPESPIQPPRFFTFSR